MGTKNKVFAFKFDWLEYFKEIEKSRITLSKFNTLVGLSQIFGWIGLGQVGLKA